MSIRRPDRSIEVHVDPITVNVPAAAQTALDEVLALLQSLQQKADAIMADLSVLTAEVAENTTVIQSAVALIGGLAQQIRDLANDPVALQALADELDGSTNTLAAAVAENTPEPPPEPEP